MRGTERGREGGERRTGRGRRTGSGPCDDVGRLFGILDRNVGRPASRALPDWSPGNGQKSRLVYVENYVVGDGMSFFYSIYIVYEICDKIIKMELQLLRIISDDH
jgi:hypothetical protein